MHLRVLTLSTFCALTFTAWTTHANPRLLCAQACQHTAACSGDSSAHPTCVQRCVRTARNLPLKRLQAFHTCVQSASCSNASEAQTICRGFLTPPPTPIATRSRFLTLTDQTQGSEGAHVDAVLLLKADGRLFAATSLHNRSKHTRRLNTHTKKPRYHPIFHPNEPDCPLDQLHDPETPLCRDPSPLLSLPAPKNASNLHLLLGYPNASCTQLGFGLLGGQDPNTPVVLSFEDNRSPVWIEPGDTIIVHTWDRATCTGQSDAKTHINIGVTSDPNSPKSHRPLGTVHSQNRALRIAP